MECTHDPNPALDSLLFLTGADDDDPGDYGYPGGSSDPSSSSDNDGYNDGGSKRRRINAYDDPPEKLLFICQRQVVGGFEGQKCGAKIYSFLHTRRKSCKDCLGKDTSKTEGRFEHSDFLQVKNAPPQDTTALRYRPGGSRRIRWGYMTINAIITKQDSKCNVCKDQLKVGLFDRDHVVAIADDGPDHPDNLQVLCLECHRKKTIRERGARRLKKQAARRLKKQAA